MSRTDTQTEQQWDRKRWSQRNGKATTTKTTSTMWMAHTWDTMKRIKCEVTNGKSFLFKFAKKLRKRTLRRWSHRGRSRLCNTAQPCSLALMVTRVTTCRASPGSQASNWPCAFCACPGSPGLRSSAGYAVRCPPLAVSCSFLLILCRRHL